MQILPDIIAALPPLQGARDVIVKGQQSVKDIMTEVLDSHQVFASDYDTIVDFFAVDADPLRALFKFCRDNMPYVAESERDQTSRSPIAILMLANNWGVDCKHYSGWIAGVIDAMNRAGYSNYDWSYRFASYNPFSPTKEHVFVVVTDPGGDEIWIDPAPVINSDGSYTQRSFNDRKVIPFYVTDKKPTSMSINRISGCCNSINPRYQSMGYVSLWQPAGDDNYYPVYERPWDNFYGSLTQQFYPSTPIDFVDPVDTMYEPEPQPVLSDTGGGYVLAPGDTLTTLELIDFGPTVFYDPGFPVVDTAIQTDLNRIESTTFPAILDYPTVTGETPLTLPTTTTSTTAVATTTTDTGLKTGFDLMTFIKTNPVETILIGSAIVVGGIYLIKRKKKK